MRWASPAAPDPTHCLSRGSPPRSSPLAYHQRINNACRNQRCTSLGKLRAQSALANATSTHSPAVEKLPSQFYRLPLSGMLQRASLFLRRSAIKRAALYCMGPPWTQRAQIERPGTMSTANSPTKLATHPPLPNATATAILYSTSGHVAHTANDRHKMHLWVAQPGATGM